MQSDVQEGPPKKKRRAAFGDITNANVCWLFFSVHFEYECYLIVTAKFYLLWMCL